jgi:5-methyltetrahydrofolate--homocysteine methyltransferase
MDLDRIRQAIVDGDDKAGDLCQEALDADYPPGDILNQGLLAGMTEVGRLFRDGEYFVPDVLVSADAMQRGMTVLRPHLNQAGVKPTATAVVGTVKGDLHDIGKNLVATMLEGAGFDVIDLGVDVEPETFVDACRERKVDLVGLSALLTTTMPAMALTIERLRTETHPTPIVFVGGAPVTQEYADSIGADGYSRDAASGAELARRLIQQ